MAATTEGAGEAVLGVVRGQVDAARPGRVVHQIAHVERDRVQPQPVGQARVGEQRGVVLGQPAGDGCVVLGPGPVGLRVGHVEVRVGAEPQQHVEVEIGRRAAGPLRSSIAVTWVPSHSTFSNVRSPWTSVAGENGSSTARGRAHEVDGVAQQPAVDMRQPQRAVQRAQQRRGRRRPVGVEQLGRRRQRGQRRRVWRGVERLEPSGQRPHRPPPIPGAHVRPTLSQGRTGRSPGDHPVAPQRAAVGDELRVADGGR